MTGRRGLSHVQVDRFSVPGRRGDDYGIVKVRAGESTPVRVDSNTGFWTVFEYPVNVEISVSPTGRSVRVYVNGRQVHP